MGLKEIGLRRDTVKTADGDTFTVRGLNVPDIVQIVEVNKPAVAALFDRLSGKDANSISVSDATSLITELISIAPQACAHAIALVADDQVVDRDGMFDAALRLPLDVQADALEKIAVLSFRMEGGPKKFVETVLRIAKGVNGLAKHRPR